MKKVVWKRMTSTCQGRSHLADQVVCQDSVSTSYARNVNTVALSDGAGSCSHSHIGSALCTRSLCSIMSHHFDEIWNMNPDDAKAKILQTLKEQLHAEANKQELEYHDLSATALAVAVKKNRFISFHVGDGVIGFELTDRDGKKRLGAISIPNNGEHCNETVFVTSRTALQHATFQCGSIKQPDGESITGFILMSDGPEAALFKKSDSTLAPACSKLLESARDLKKKDMNSGLKHTLEFIANSKTQDDCSIALMAHV
ncbi:MAG: PP2C family serine/threonine-protein phosphatase [Coriobacteriaceae bacterium]|nr:PP2C family serine/threonine-protein phosphatase [Coriobacteriaceae bacterium]